MTNNLMINYFISDLHLSNERPDLIRAFVNLMKLILKEKKITSTHIRLYILGDFYDRWIGDDYQSNWNDEIEETLCELSQNNIEIIVLHGNRDFLLGKKWAHRIGANLVIDDLVIKEKQHSILLSHGDQACLDDIEYQKFRTLVRSSEWQHDFLALSLEERLSISEGLRSKSKSIKSEKALEIMDVNRAEINRLMLEHQTTLMIHGHTHRPKLHNEKQGYRMVLGDWDSHAWLAILQNNQLQQIEIGLLELNSVPNTMNELINNSRVAQKLLL